MFSRVLIVHYLLFYIFPPLLDITQTGRGFSSPAWSHLLPWSSSTQRSSLESGASLYSTILGVLRLYFFFGIFCPEQNLCFLWYFVAPMIDIDTIDSLSLDALTCWSFHPNGMSNSPMNERNNSLPREINSNTQIHRQDTILLLSQHNMVFMHKFFCLISLGLLNM